MDAQFVEVRYGYAVVDLSPYHQLDAIELISNIVRKRWKLEVTFADHKGYVLDHAEGKIRPSANEFCRAALFSKEGFRRCNESVKVVRDRLSGARRRSLLVHPCHLGFDIISSPIYHYDELVGFLFTGGGISRELGSSAKAELTSKVREFATLSTDAANCGVRDLPRLSSVEMEQLGDLIELGAALVSKALRTETRLKKVASEDSSAAAPSPFPELVGSAPVMQSVYNLLKKIVRSQSTVLIHGESGTGKEIVARTIHFHGPRASKPFVVQNCSAFNDNLLESALFGHARGAFTGAVKEKKGLFEVADGGTFFLDEIGDMSAALQVKLLRVLQEGTFTPVGATKPIKVDVRILAASHKDLTQMVANNQFREDLYYRINVLRISMPPLRERLEDLPILVGHFLTKHYRGDGQPPTLAPAAMAALASYSWPGNIRELENEIERLLVLGVDETTLGESLLSDRVRLAKSSLGPNRAAKHEKYDKSGTLREVVERVEAEVIRQGLIRTHWNKSQLAKELGISRSSLIQKCANYGLEK